MAPMGISRFLGPKAKNTLIALYKNGNIVVKNSDMFFDNRSNAPSILFHKQQPKQPHWELVNFGVEMEKKYTYCTLPKRQYCHKIFSRCIFDNQAKKKNYSLETNILNFLSWGWIKKNIKPAKALAKFTPIHHWQGCQLKSGQKGSFLRKCTPHCFCMTFEQSN